MQVHSLNHSSWGENSLPAPILLEGRHEVRQLSNAAPPEGRGVMAGDGRALARGGCAQGAEASRGACHLELSLAWITSLLTGEEGGKALFWTPNFIVWRLCWCFINSFLGFACHCQISWELPWGFSKDVNGDRGPLSFIYFSLLQPRRDYKHFAQLPPILNLPHLLQEWKISPKVLSLKGEEEKGFPRDGLWSFMSKGLAPASQANCYLYSLNLLLHLLL